MAQIITKVEWEKNISQIQLGARQSSGQSIYSFMAQELPKEAQKAYQNKELYMPDMYKSPSIMQFEMMGQNIGINGNDVQKTTRESLQSFPSSVLGLHAQKIIDAYNSGPKTAAQAALSAEGTGWGNALTKAAHGDYQGAIFGPVAEESIAMKMALKAGLFLALGTAAYQIATAENKWDEAEKQGLILTGTGLAGGVVTLAAGAAGLGVLGSVPNNFT